MLQAPQPNSVQYTNTNHSECNEWHNGQWDTSQQPRPKPLRIRWEKHSKPLLALDKFLDPIHWGPPIHHPLKIHFNKVVPPTDRPGATHSTHWGSKPESVSVDGRDWRIHLWSDALSIPPDLLMCLCRQHFFGSQKARRSESRWELHGGIHGRYVPKFKRWKPFA